jgi:hypothetical protein
MCDYDLRGQVEPRCPECGYRFEWDELRDPTRRWHPYLFEHHPRRPIRSFLRTLDGGLRPRRFWTTLHPAQPSSPARLAAYLSIVVLVALIPLPIAAAFYQLRWSARGSNVTLFAWFNSPWHRYVAFELAVAHVIPLVWFVATAAALQLFQLSISNARLRPSHLVRIVVYGGDVLIWMTLAQLILLAPVAPLAWSGRIREVILYPVAYFVLLPLTTWVVFAYRLWRGLALYARFDRPLATLLATQVITALVVGVLCVWGSIWSYGL